MLRQLGLAFFFSVTLVGNLRTAKADVAPVDACFDEGASCNNVAGGTGMGTCQKAKCQRAAPPGEAGAGGDRIIIYDCLRCLGGAGGSGGSASGGSGGSAGSAGSAGVTSGGCDCSVGRFRQDHALALLMFASGLYLVRRSRRQR